MRSDLIAVAVELVVLVVAAMAVADAEIIGLTEEYPLALGPRGDTDAAAR